VRPARRLLQRNVAARIPFEQPRHDRRQYVREEALEAQFTELLGRLIARGRADGSLREDLSVSDIPMLMCGLSSSMGMGFDWRRHLEFILDGMRGPAARPRTGHLPATKPPASIKNA